MYQYEKLYANGKMAYSLHALHWFVGHIVPNDRTGDENF